MDRNIIVIVEEKEGKIRRASYELLSKAQELKRQFDTKNYALLFSKDSERLAKIVKDYADFVVYLEDDPMSFFSSFALFLKSLIEEKRPFLTMASAWDYGAELLAFSSSLLSIPIFSEAIDLRTQNGSILLKKALFGGKVFAWYRVDFPILVTFRPKSFSIQKGELNGEVIKGSGSRKGDEKVRINSEEEIERKEIGLEEADFIICGGMGLKGKENFKMLEEIAGLLKGAVGASRAVVDSGWRSKEEQIGKSGKVVSPKIYLGCGVSGAIHHIMGIDTSQIIVAINKDKNAPIFNHADYGIIDDLFEILPLLKEELKKLGS